MIYTENQAWKKKKNVRKDQNIDSYVKLKSIKEKFTFTFLAVFS